MFVDRVKIRVEAGSGGKGMTSFRREKYVPKGGPDGGNGGQGADVALVAKSSEQSLINLKNQFLWRAERGENGGSRQKTGADGKLLEVIVPVGTLVFDSESGDLLCDLKEDEQQYIAAKGGRGGKGNLHFASSTNRAPRFSQPGEEGEIKLLDLELKIVADVGLIGFPNAGKSTFLRAISAARPKTASYPFTTRNPAMGVVETEDFRRYTVADIPGLLQGAHMNVGLGHEFLRHIERCRVLCYVLDMAGVDARDPLEDLQILQDELEQYEKGLSEKAVLIVANKMDLPEAKENLQRLKESDNKLQIIPVCAELAENTDEVIIALRKIIDNTPEPDEEDLLRLLAKRRNQRRKNRNDYVEEDAQ
jgi:GTP-binding protein